MSIGFTPHHPASSPPTAHAVRSPSVARQIRDAMLPAAPLTPLPDREEDVAGEIIACLRSGPIRDFDISTAAIVGKAGIEGRVIVRFGKDGASQVRSLATIEASLTAILLRLEPDLRGHHLFADAFCLAAQEAENKVDAVHAWSRSIRPTDEAEG